MSADRFTTRRACLCLYALSPDSGVVARAEPAKWPDNQRDRESGVVKLSLVSERASKRLVPLKRAFGYNR